MFGFLSRESTGWSLSFINEREKWMDSMDLTQSLSMVTWQCFSFSFWHMCMRVFTPAWVCMESRGWCLMSFSIAFHFTYRVRVFWWIQSSPDGQADQLAWGSYLSSAGTWFLLWLGSWILVFMFAGKCLSTQPPPQSPLFSFFLFFSF